MSKLVDLSYEELKAKMDKANKAKNYRKSIDYSVALVTKICYHIQLDREWVLTNQIREIDEIIASIHEKNIQDKDKDILISKLNKVKTLKLEMLEAVKKEIANYK